MSQPSNNIPVGDTQFYDNCILNLPAGNYEITVTQSLPNSDTSDFSQTVSQQFVVDGPRFTLASSEIHAQFPQANANGDFTLALPNVVLQNAALPWERTITSTTGVPWLALLVFQSSEVVLDPTTNSPLLTGTVADFLAPVPTVVKPDIDASTLADAVLASPMNSILIRTDVFSAVTPRLNELASLAHVREVNPAIQVLDESANDGWYSVVIANRFPISSNPDDSAGATNYVHLVSLEGLTTYLTDSPTWPEGAERVQIASLASWQFVSAQQPGETFSDLATALIDSASSTDDLLLRIPADNNGSTAAYRLSYGYTALSSHTMPGPDTFAWYRGPFTAVPAPELPDNGCAVRASTETIYDQPNAIFDHSYSAAWSLGRLSALADPVFVTSLQQVRSSMLRTANRLLARSKMPHLTGISDLAMLASPGLTRREFQRRIRVGMGTGLTRALAAAPSTAVPSTAPPAKNFLFPSDDPPASPAAELRWFLQKVPVREFLVEQVDSDLGPLADWLARLALFYNVPFNHLVPDQRMLPVESIRFFYVDQGWIKALVDGAMTIAVHGSLDYELQSMLSQTLWERTQRAIGNVRARLSRGSVGSSLQPYMAQAGMLLRSALVSGWPGLAISATQGQDTVEPLRIDRLGPNLLLALWKTVPTLVTISQPQQGLNFGASDGWVISLRSLSGTNLGEETGATFPSIGNLTQYMRAANGDIGGNVLNLIPANSADNSSYLIPSLSSALRMTTLTPSQFAIEMVMAPERIIFNPA